MEDGMLIDVPISTPCKVAYDREFLLGLRDCELAKIKPSGLPNYPEVISEKPVSFNGDFQNQREFSNNYKWTSLAPPTGQTPRRKAAHNSKMTQNASTTPLKSEKGRWKKLGAETTSNEVQTSEKVEQPHTLQPGVPEASSVSGSHTASEVISEQGVTSSMSGVQTELKVISEQDIKSSMSVIQTEPEVIREHNVASSMTGMKTELNVISEEEESLTPGSSRRKDDKVTQQSKEPPLDGRTTKKERNAQKEVKTKEERNMWAREAKPKCAEQMYGINHQNRQVEVTMTSPREDTAGKLPMRRNKEGVLSKPKEPDTQPLIEKIDRNEKEDVAKSDEEPSSTDAKVCDPCYDSNEQEKAVAYCVECEDFLCDICSRGHRKSKLSRSHHLLENDDMPKTSIRNTLPNGGFCSKHGHGNELLRWYCNKHREFICSLCIRIKHSRTCRLECIQEIAPGFSESAEYKGVVTTLCSMSLQLRDQKEVSSKNADDVEHSETEMLTEIRKFRSAINKKWDILEVAAVNYMKEECQRKTNMMRRLSDTCAEKEIEVNKMNANLKQLEELKQKQPLVIATKQLEERIGHLSCAVEYLCKTQSTVSLKFKPNKHLIDALTGCYSLGEIEVINETTLPIDSQEVVKDNPETNTPDEANDSSQEKPTVFQRTVTKVKHTNTTLEAKGIAKTNPTNNANKTVDRVAKAKGSNKTPATNGMDKTDLTTNVNKTVFSVNHKRNINIKHTTDRTDLECLITGCARVVDGKLVLVDYNNHRIKLIDVRIGVIMAVALVPYGPPRDVTCIEGKELVVTCGNFLLFMDAGTLNGKKTISLDGCSSGIDHHQDTLYVTFIAPVPSVKIMDTTGNVLKVFSAMHPLYVNVTASGDTVVIADKTHVAVVNVLNDKRLTIPVDPYGLVVSGNENLLVTEIRGTSCLFGWHLPQSSNEITFDQAKPLVQFNGHPLAVQFCGSRQEIYVTFSGKYSNHLAVYNVDYEK